MEPRRGRSSGLSYRQSLPTFKGYIKSPEYRRQAREPAAAAPPNPRRSSHPTFQPNVAYKGPCLWRLPGAIVVLLRDDRRVLLTRRANDGTWCLPAGAAEPGGSFARTAIEELSEEAGVEVAESNMVPFGCLSEAELYTIHYPGGDVTTALPSASWRGLGGVSLSQTGRSRRRRGSWIFSAPSQLVHPPTAHALNLLVAYLRTLFPGALSAGMHNRTSRFGHAAIGPGGWRRREYRT